MQLSKMPEPLFYQAVDVVQQYRTGMILRIPSSLQGIDQ